MPVKAVSTGHSSGGSELDPHRDWTHAYSRGMPIVMCILKYHKHPISKLTGQVVADETVIYTCEMMLLSVN